MSDATLPNANPQLSSRVSTALPTLTTILLALDSSDLDDSGVFPFVGIPPGIPPGTALPNTTGTWTS